MTKPIRSAALIVLLLSTSALTLAQSPVQQSLDEQVRSVAPQVRAAYETIHRRPELGKQEAETSRLVRSRLEQLGYRMFVPVKSLPTAVIAVLDTGRPGPVTCLRAELDALRMEEKTGLPFASQVPGIMHACGHDAHAAILLGAAEVLLKERDSLSGKIVLLFQPAEEVAGGADDIVADGVLNRLGVSNVFALHVAQGVPVGTIQVSPGPVLASSNSFTVEVTGSSLHAAMPHLGNDVLIAAAEMAAGLVKLPARKLDVVSRPAVISVAYFNSGDEKTVNRVPAKAVFKGTIRTYEDVDAPFEGDPSIRSLVDGYLRNMAQSMGVKVTLDLKKNSPPTVNDTALYGRVVESLRPLWPGPRLQPSFRGMAAEDFSYYTAKHPSLYFGLGIAKDGLGMVGVHQNNFTIHPDALEEGVKLMVAVARANSQAR